MKPCVRSLACSQLWASYFCTRRAALLPARNGASFTTSPVDYGQPWWWNSGEVWECAHMPFQVGSVFSALRALFPKRKQGNGRHSKAWKLRFGACHPCLRVRCSPEAVTAVQAQCVHNLRGRKICREPWPGPATLYYKHLLQAGQSSLIFINTVSDQTWFWSSSRHRKNKYLCCSL